MSRPHPGAPILALILSAVTLGFTGAAIAGTCDWMFDPVIGQPGLASASGGSSARAFAILDGDLVAGGSFISAGGVPAVAAARWNGTSWSPMGDGFSSTVHALPWFQGDLYAVGQFQYAWPNVAWRAARWNGSAWDPLGPDHGLQRPSDFQYAVAYDGIAVGESLIVAGEFTRAGDAAVGLVAAWDGTDWSPLGAGFDTLASVAGTCQWATYPSVFDLELYEGELIAGGSFQLLANGDTASCIARWDGTSWQPLGGGMTGGMGTGTADCGPPWVFAMAVWNGDLIVGGQFEKAGGVTANRVARWDGTQWHAMGSEWFTGRGGSVWALAVTAGNELIAGGWLQQPGADFNKWQLAKWNGSDWEQLGPDLTWISTPSVYTLFPWGDDLAIGGAFGGTADGDTMNYVTIMRCNASVDVAAPGFASGLELSAAGPNPFFGATAIAFDLPRDADHVALQLVDLAGRRVRTLHDGPASAGRHILPWQGRDDDGARVPAGVYFAQLRTEDETKAIRLVRLR